MPIFIIKTTIDTGDMDAFYAGMFGTIVTAIFMYIILFPEAKKKYKERKRLKEIKEKGIKVEGNIIDYKTYSARNSEINNVIDKSYYYTVIVEYVDPHTKEKKNMKPQDLHLMHIIVQEAKNVAYMYMKTKYMLLILYQSIKAKKIFVQEKMAIIMMLKIQKVKK